MRTLIGIGIICWLAHNCAEMTGGWMWLTLVALVVAVVQDLNELARRTQKIRKVKEEK